MTYLLTTAVVWRHRRNKPQLPQTNRATLCVAVHVL